MADVSIPLKIECKKNNAQKTSDITDAFSANAALFGATVSDADMLGIFFTCTLTFVNTKSAAEIETFIRQIKADVDGEVTLTSPRLVLDWGIT